MRIIPALLLVLLAPVALAQPCDPAQTDEVCPDTTDWRRYFPLEVGNQWQYQDNFYDEPVTHWSWTITGQTGVGGQSYFELERCDEAADGSAICTDPVLLRYDDEHELIARRTESGEAWWDVLPCGLGAAFNTGEAFDEDYECTGPAEGFVFVSSQGAYGATVVVPPDEVTGDTRKDFMMYPGTGPEMYAGLGVTKYYYDLEEVPTQLVYAHVAGEQVGTPAFASCDPAEVGGGVVCPDTTNWRRYLPLEIGNQWQYEVRGSGAPYPPYDHGTEIVDETVIDGEVYFLARRCERDVFEEEEVSCGEPFPIRYDDDARAVVRRFEDEQGVPTFELFHTSDHGLNIYAPPCPLDGYFGEGAQDCGAFGSRFYFVGGGYGIGFGGLGDTEKSFGDLVGSITLVAGIGAVGSVVDDTAGETLAYARVGAEEVGTPIFAFPTPNEPGAAQPIATTFTQTYPNPARGTMRAQYALGAPQAVTLELIDLLGRRVRSAAMGPQPAGAHDVRLDLNGLRAGLYVLRLRGDAGAEATRRIVVVR